MSPSNVVEFPNRSRKNTLREAYAESLLAGSDTYDLLEKESVRVMVGYLTGASVAFRVLGDMEAAEWCEQGAQSIIDDWEHFRTHIAMVRVKLCAPK